MMDYLRMLRIGDWIRFYTLVPLVGALLVGENAGRIPVILIIYFFLISYAFVVNNYFDVEIDRLNSRKMDQRKNPMASGKASERGVIFMILLLIGLALLLSLQTSYVGTALVILNLLLFTAYSASPIRLKERVGLDVMTHGLMFGFLPLLAGYFFCCDEISFSWSLYAASALAFLIGCEALVAHQLVDYDLDRRSTRTTVTVIGRMYGLILQCLLTGLSLVVLLAVATFYQVPGWLVAGVGWYLLAYPAYSCREVFHDIRHRALAE